MYTTIAFVTLVAVILYPLFASQSMKVLETVNHLWTKMQLVTLSATFSVQN